MTLRIKSIAESVISIILFVVSFAYNHDIVNEALFVTTWFVLGPVFFIFAVRTMVLLRKSKSLWAGETLRENVRRCKFLISWEIFWGIFTIFFLYLHLSPDE